MKIQDETVQHTNKWWFAAYVGFFAGLVWGAVKLIEFYFHFTQLTPGFLIEPFYKHSFLLTWTGMLLGWLFFIVFSVIASFLYAIFFAKMKGPWLGLIYGFAWWALLYLLVGPVSGMMSWTPGMDANTLTTDVCLFIVWGLFIGYSISIEFTDERAREPFQKGA